MAMSVTPHTTSAKRKPSTMPTIGLIPCNVRPGSCNRLLGYAIGAANSQNCGEKRDDIANVAKLNIQR